MTNKEIRYYARIALLEKLHNQRVLQDLAIKQESTEIKKILTDEIKAIHKKINELDDLDREEERRNK